MGKPQDTYMMEEGKHRLEQLEDVNMELKDDNVKLGAQLERALTQIQDKEAENEVVVEMEKECATLKQNLKVLECLLDENYLVAKDKSKVMDNSKQGRGKRAGKGRWRKNVLLLKKISID